MKKISVIIPVYNVEKYLDRCIQSVLNQTYKSFELILIDDGSTDKSGEIADRYSKEDDRVVVKHVKNGGSSAARNAGLDIATGEYIAFVDSDDYIEPEHLETLEKYMTDDVDLVAAQANYYDTDNKPTNLREPSQDLKLKYNDVRNFCGSNRHFWVWAALFRRALIGDLRFKIEYHFGEDALFYYTYLKRVRLVRHISEKTYNYIVYTQSACHGKPDEKKYTELYSWRDICLLYADEPQIYRACRGEYGKRAFKRYLSMNQWHVKDIEKRKELRRIMRKSYFCYMTIKGYEIGKRRKLAYTTYMFGFDRISDWYFR